MNILAGTLEVNGDFAPWPCGAELPGLPSDCGASRAPSSPPGWMTLSLGTGSGSKATPAMPPSTPTATVAAVIKPMTLSRLLLKYSAEDFTGGGVDGGVWGVLTRHPRRRERPDRRDRPDRLDRRQPPRPVRR